VLTPTLLDFIKDYCSKETIELFIIGLPKRLNNEQSEVEKLIQPFILKLQSQHPTIPIKRIDERFSSKLAFQSMIESGTKKKDRRNKATIDQISATIILQSYLYYK